MLVIPENSVMYNFKNGCEYGINSQGETGYCDTDPIFMKGGLTDSRDVPDQHFDLRLSEQSPFKNQVPAIAIR